MIHKGFYTICSRPNNSDAKTFWFIRILASFRGVLEYTGLFLYIFSGDGDRVVSLFDGLIHETPPERNTFFRLQVYNRLGMPRNERYKRAGKYVI